MRNDLSLATPNFNLLLAWLYYSFTHQLLLLKFFLQFLILCSDYILIDLSLAIDISIGVGPFFGLLVLNIAAAFIRVVSLASLLFVGTTNHKDHHLLSFLCIWLIIMVTLIGLVV